MLVACFFLATATATAQQQPKRVLLLFDENQDFPGLMLLDSNLTSTLRAGTTERLEIYREFMDLSRFPDDNHKMKLRDYYKVKYGEKKIDVFFAVMGPSFEFLLKYGAEISPGVPIVFCGIDKREVGGRDFGPNVTGVMLKREFKPTLELALRLQPDVRQVIFINGTSDFSRYWGEQARKELSEFEGRVTIKYMQDLPMEDIRKEVSHLAPDAIIVYLHVFRDSAGNTFQPDQALSLVAERANVPIYVFLDQFVGKGALGGYVYSMEAQGTKAALIGLRILKGESPANIGISDEGTNVNMFDFRQLRRWGISESKLPPASIIRFREATFWEQYQWRIIGVISVCVLEALLIVGLLLSRSRRRRAELERERFAKLAEDEHKSLEEVVTNVPGSVWESIAEPETGLRKTRFISQNVEKMLGYGVEEWLSTPGFGLKIIHDEDRERVRAETDEIIQSCKSGVVQFRTVRKDGRVVWLEAHETAILDDRGKPIGLRGVTLDVTERKLAEESLRQSEDRNNAILRAIPDLMFLQSLDGTYLDYHASDSRDLLAPPIAFLGKNMRDVMPPDLVEGFFDCFRRADETGEPQIMEYNLSLHGEDRGFEARMVRTNGSKILSVVRDVTIRKQVEESLRQSEARFRAMADTAPVLIWMSGADRLCTYVNQQWLHFTGRSIEQELGNGWTDGIFHGDVSRCRETYDSAFDRRAPFQLEYRLRRADGLYRWVYDSGTPRFSTSGEFLGFIGSCLDISDRKEAEVALQRAVEEVSELKNQLQAENIYLQEEIKLAHNFDEIIGESDSLKYVLYKIEQVAPTNSTVLITGETGTGKELVARAIHNTSLRQNRSLVKVNCAALSASLIESELFGHEKGSFTGAMARKIGRFELANGGTIFLDEIGELPIELQVKLLRVIQEGEFERLGSSKTVKVDVRIIAATNRHLPIEVQKGNFREDLWYRLNVFPITVPPLRQRVDDIPRLVEHFVMKFAKKLGKEISSVSPSTHRSFTNYSWPGNIRELANIIERAVINTPGTVLRVSDQFEESRSDGSHGSRKTLEEIEREYIIKALGESGWRIEGPVGAAKSLGLNPSTLRTRMAKLGIQKPSQSVVLGHGS